MECKCKAVVGPQASGGNLSFMQDGCSWPFHVNILRQRYVGANTTLCLYYRSCGSATPLNLRSTTPPLEPQPRLNHPNPAATPTTEVDCILVFYGIDPVLASLSNLKIAKISRFFFARAGHGTHQIRTNKSFCTAMRAFARLRFCGRNRG